MFNFKSLRDTYEEFKNPVASIEVNGKLLTKDKNAFAVSGISVDLTSNFEASAAEFTIYNVYDTDSRSYRFEDVKKYIFLGSTVVISLGYGKTVREVFRGFICQVDFVFREEHVPGIEVHALDVKGMMMANNYSKQIKANAYSDAVEEIFRQSAYVKLKENEVFRKLSITATPDKQGAPGAGGAPAAGGAAGGGSGPTDQTIEMVAESDYEFVVKAAKKFNYEFFTQSDTVCFRRAKGDPSTLIALGPESGLMSFDISYDITGLVEGIEVRNTDVSKGTAVSAVRKMNNKISYGSKAKQLLSRQRKVYIDPTAASQKDADYRAQFLLEDMSYRFGTLNADVIGLPELVPGRFIKIEGLGKGPQNSFYITDVRHMMEEQSFYRTRITGKAASLPAV